jgi:hypothetical protein
MTAVRVLTDVAQNPPLKDVPKEKVISITSGVTFSRVPGGMASGNSSVGISAPLPDGKHLLIELSMANFQGVATVFRGAEERDSPVPGHN